MALAIFEDAERDYEKHHLKRRPLTRPLTAAPHRYKPSDVPPQLENDVYDVILIHLSAVMKLAGARCR